MSNQTTGESFEEFVKKVLGDIKEHIDLVRVDGKQKFHGKSGAEWEIDLVAYSKNNKPILIECKFRSKSKLEQSLLSHFAYVLKDTEAKYGIIATTTSLQKGAKILSDYENIKELKIDPRSTYDSYVARFLESIFIKPPAAKIRFKWSAEVKSIKPNGTVIDIK